MNNPVVAVGTVEGERFVIERLAGSGGMSTVYRALDQKTGKPVAIKYLALRTSLQQEAARFMREIRILADLHHPGIVAYVHHGQSAAGLPYLVMEWLEGEDLEHRLKRGPLSISQSVLLVKTVCSALQLLHSRDIVHRDIKPTNLFLRDGRLDGVTLLDMGVARHSVSNRTVTQTGYIVGTPEYMSPEQARGVRDITPASDIFSLGCVLYECLTGQPSFLSEQVSALLARILFDDAPRLSTSWRNVSPQLDELVQSMLRRDPAQRPATASALLDELDKIPVIDESASISPLPKAQTGVSAEEQQLVSVVMAVDACAEKDEGTAEAASPSQVSADRSLLRLRLADFPAPIEWLADGSLCATLRSQGSAVDQVTSAARLALAIREAWPSAIIAMSTGRSIVRERLPIGEAIERSVRLLRGAQERLQVSPEGSRSLAQVTRGVWVDPLSADFLERRFVLETQPDGRVLIAELDSMDEARTLLGRPTTYVGRDNDLSMLELALSNVLEELAPWAVLVTAPPGFGKSRLRHEFVRRKGLQGQPLSLLAGRGDPLAVGTPYAPLAQALRRACGIYSSDPGPEQQAKIRQHLQDLFSAQSGGDAQAAMGGVPATLAEFLGELMGVHFPDETSVQLRAARSDPKVMGDQVTQAFLRYLSQAASSVPVLLIVEDLHWCDSQSIKLIDMALREVKQPLLVLALARTDIHTLYPQLWAGRVQEIKLSGLSRRPAERLVRQILGEEASAALVTQLVTKADGNAFYLEELIRAVATGKSDSLPETILAMLQVRLRTLDPISRRVLRAASVFGESFWIKGVQALQPAQLTEYELAQTIASLVEAELIAPRRESRLPNEAEYGFRHSLVREATYGLLTDEDRVNAHCLAAAYLQDAGEPDPMVLAEHWRLGQFSERAVAPYTRAAEQALAANDLHATLDRVDRAIQCGASGEALGILQSLACTAHFWRDDFQSAYPAGCQALDLLPRGGLPWMQSLGNMLTFTSLMGKHDHFRSLIGEFSTAAPTRDALGMYVEAGSLLVSMFSFGGIRDAAQGFLALVASVGQPSLASDPLARAWFKQAHAIFALMLGEDPSHAVEQARDGLAAACEAGSRRNQILVRAFLGMALQWQGDASGAESVLRGNLDHALRLAEPLSISHAKVWLAMALRCRSEAPAQREAAELASTVLAIPGANAFYVVASQCVLASARLFFGDFEGAEAAFVAAAPLHRYLPILHGLALSTQLAALRAAGRGDEARQLSVSAQALLHRLGSLGFADPPLRRELAAVASL